MKRKTFLKFCFLVVFIEYIIFYIIFVTVSLLFKLLKIDNASIYIGFSVIIVLSLFLMTIYNTSISMKNINKCDLLLQSEPIEVIPLENDPYNFIKNLSKISKFYAYQNSNFEEYVNVCIKFENEDTQILYKTVKKADFFDYFEIKQMSVRETK